MTFVRYIIPLIVEANKQSIRALVKRNNRQMGIFEMINGQRYKSFTRFLLIKNKYLTSNFLFKYKDKNLYTII